MAYYPDITYPDDPEFPLGHEDVPWGTDLYNVITSYIEDMTIDVNRLIDHDGSLDIYESYGIKWDGTERISIIDDEIHVTALQVNSGLVVNTASFATLTVTSRLSVIDDLYMNGNMAVSATITVPYAERDVYTLTQAAAPASPAEDHAVIWYSNGTGYGDQGDLCVIITESATTKTFTITDYSGL